MVELKNEVGEIVEVPKDRVEILKKRGWVDLSESAVIKEVGQKPKAVKSESSKSKKK